jgi:hypothetical protein
MANLQSERKLENMLTTTTAETVQSSLTVATPDGVQSTFDAAHDPAFGALEISPDLDLKIRKALTRAARQIAFRQQLRLPLFYFVYLTLEVRRLMLLAKGYALGQIGELRGSICHRKILPFATQSQKGVCVNYRLLSSPGYSPL